MRRRRTPVNEYPVSRFDLADCFFSGYMHSYFSCILVLLTIPITRLPAQFTATVAKETTLMLLSGIRIAATRGVRYPATATLNAMALYRKEIMNAPSRIREEYFANTRNRSNMAMFLPSRIPSQAGVNTPVSSVTARPTSLCLRAPESLSPSPTMSTFLPTCCKLLMNSIFSCGDCSKRSWTDGPKRVSIDDLSASLSPDSNATHFLPNRSSITLKFLLTEVL